MNCLTCQKPCQGKYCSILCRATCPRWVRALAERKAIRQDREEKRKAFR
jgi:hypothetical protein